MTYNPSPAVSHAAEYFTTIETNPETGLDEIVRVPVENVRGVQSSRRMTFDWDGSEYSHVNCFRPDRGKDRNAGDVLAGRARRGDDWA